MSTATLRTTEPAGRAAPEGPESGATIVIRAEEPK